MDELELCNIIDDHINRNDEGEISQARQTIFDRYMGEVYGNEKEGQSKITTREVFETVEWAMPSIVRVFESGDRIIEFDANHPDDESAAEQETDAVNNVYRKDNNGFVVTHNLIKSALMNPNSYVKVYRDESEEVITENYENLNENELAQLDGDKEVEITGQDMNEYGLYDIELKRTCKRGKNKVICIPEDEITIASNHSDLSLDDCEFVCHHPQKTHSYLLGLGYSEKDLDECRNNEKFTSEESNRNFYTDEEDLDDESHKALRKYTVYACEMLVDWDDDGIAERRYVVKIGNKIFENEESDMMPIAAAATIIMPHKHTGMSLAQSIIDLQDLKTYFMRQTVTNMGRVNNPRTLVTKGANLQDVLSNRSNGIIRIKNVGDVTTEPTTPIIGQILPLLDLIDAQKEGRSGITRNSMGLDADILAKSTEGAFMGAIEKAEQRVEFIVRVLAETVFKDIFLKLHHLILTHGDTKWMKLNGQWVEVNPAEWRKREAMTVNVGLGMGNRQQKRITAQVITQDHDRLVATGGLGTLITPQNIYNGRRLMIEAAGESNVDKYYMNPEKAQPKPQQPPQPDPNMIMIQANQQIEKEKRQVEMAKLQQAGQIKQAEMQFDQAKLMRESQFNQVELQYTQQIDQLKASLAQSKNDNDAGTKALQVKLDRIELQLKDAQADEKLSMDKYIADANNQTKVLIEQMKSKESTQPLYEEIEEREKIVSQSLESMSAIINDMNQAKEIVRDEDGTPIGVKNTSTGVIRNIVKNEEGLPVGIE